jgi:hypothetical protein
MTTFNSSQLSNVNVLGGVASGFNASQIGVVAVASAPVALSLNASQLFTVIVSAQGQSVARLGPIIKLGCWTPCGVLMWNPNGGVI